MADITAEQVAAAEEQYIGVKESGDPEDKAQAAQALEDLRSAYRFQEQQAGRLAGFVSIEE